MTRFLPVSGYGEVVVGITVLNLLGIVSLLGLGTALTRYVPRATSAAGRLEIAASGYQIALGLSVVWGAIGVLGADVVAVVVFDQPSLSGVVRIFSLSLPFYVLYQLSVGGIRGEKETISKVLVGNVLLPGGRLLAVTVLALAGWGTTALAVGYNAGFAVAGLVGGWFFLRSGPYSVQSLLSPAPSGRYRELLSFSLPLAVSGSFGLVTKQSDVFFLGVFGTSDMVAVYDVAFLLSQTLLLLSFALDYLFQPIVSEFDARGDDRQLTRLYRIVTRWLVFSTFPVLCLLVLFPEVVLGTFFGSTYRASATALTILAVGFFVTRVVGLTGSFLTAIGHTKVLMYVSGATAILNVLLNIVLIPRYGIVGAALATVGARLLNNTLQSAYILRKTGVHPFVREFLYPTGLAVCLLVGVKVTGVTASITGLLPAFAVAICLGLCCLLFVLATRSVYLVEISLLGGLLGLVGIDWDHEETILTVFSK